MPSYYSSQPPIWFVNHTSLLAKPICPSTRLLFHELILWPHQLLISTEHERIQYHGPSEFTCDSHQGTRNEPSRQLLTCPIGS